MYELWDAKHNQWIMTVRHSGAALAFVNQMGWSYMKLLVSYNEEPPWDWITLAEGEDLLQLAQRSQSASHSTGTQLQSNFHHSTCP